MKLAKIVFGLIKDAEGLIGKSGADKKYFVLEQIAKLDDKTPLAVIPNEFEEQGLSLFIDLAVFFYKNKLSKAG